MSFKKCSAYKLNRAWKKCKYKTLIDIFFIKWIFYTKLYYAFEMGCQHYMKNKVGERKTKLKSQKIKSLVPLHLFFPI